jgi:uncharacterized protein (UPF0276 family)
MILTLPVGHLINGDNYHQIPSVKALEYRDTTPILDNKLESIFHSGYGIVQEEFLGYFESIVDYLNENNIKMFSFDIGPAAEKIKTEDYYYIARSEVLSKDEIRKIIRQRLKFIREKFHGDIALENLNYFPTSAYSHVCESNFISDIVRDNEVYMVLDIAHAIITVNNMEVDKYEYLASLPLNKVKEIHLSAPGVKDGKWRDFHEEPSLEVYEVLGFIKKRLIGNPYLVLEYYKSLSALREIYESLDSYSSV